MSAPVFRTASPLDVPALVNLVTSAYRGESSRSGWTTEADLLDGARIDPDVLARDIVRPDSRVVVIDGADGRPLACAHVAIEDGFGYFGMFAVDPTLQGRGTGDALLRECERIARDEWRLPGLRMAVIDVRDALIAFYVRRGYRRTGVHKPFPYGDTRFGIPRREDLRFEVLEKTFGVAP
ncbi:GNAT family N-acetyltransferase [Luteimonas sp. 3794]|uniref:GNAT family N-acetyltransferase n=1 Tax=Luteimonas sp. 3794 TaxID=2817730 RepID=UPI00285B72C0|nr:GNAT family N-acetyltransferase [Luteimonas sp. 3794]MDR6993001.1 ribosomal protein S18 acetylase RimI-like enzyme [Luteimonas sp. 3794]